jgi:hypothetical protein
MDGAMATSPYLRRTWPSRAEAERSYAARQLVRRAIRLSRASAERGRTEGARHAWLLASRLAYRCGGISGATMEKGGYGGIVLTDGLVAWSPVPVR